MPVFQTCAVVLTGDKEVYRKKEVVSGTVVLDVTEDVEVKAVRVYFYGEALAKWEDFSVLRRRSEDYVASEKYFGKVMTVFGKDLNVSGPNVTLTSGQHEYEFRFTLNTEVGFPSSYEGEYGAIRYWIKVEVDRPFLKFNQYWYRGITVIDDIDVNAKQYRTPIRRGIRKQLSKALGIGNVGTLTLISSIDRGAYCAGEMIVVSAEVKNESTKDLGKLKAQIVQKVVFTASNETQTTITVLRVLEDAPVLKESERVWKDQLLEVDPVPPSTKPRSCHIIAVSYYVKIIVEVPWGLDLETRIPITIGTIPYGYTPPTARGAAAAALMGLGEVDTSSAIAYTQCTRGFEICTKSEDNFINYSYIPMCAYVPNYVFPHPQGPGGHHPTPTVAPLTSSIKQKKANHPYGILLIRFPETHIQEFRDTIENELEDLAACEGEVIACAPQSMGQIKEWPVGTSVAMLKFPSVTAATDWFNKTRYVTNPPWMGACDAMVGTIREEFKEGLLAFSVEKTKLKRGATKQKILLFQDTFAKVIRPLRLMKTGVILVNGKQYTTLHGRWLGAGYSMSVTQWESLERFNEFEYEKQQGIYKGVNDLTNEIFEMIPVVVFQSEDLFRYQVYPVKSGPPEQFLASGGPAIPSAPFEQVPTAPFQPPSETVVTKKI